MPLSGFDVVELSTRLALRVPPFGSDIDHFKEYYPKSKNLGKTAQTNGECFFDNMAKSMRASAIQSNCEKLCQTLMQQRVQLRLPESHPQVQATLAEFLALLRENEALGDFPGGIGSWVPALMWKDTMEKIQAELDQIQQQEMRACVEADRTRQMYARQAQQEAQRQAQIEAGRALMEERAHENQGDVLSSCFIPILIAIVLYSVFGVR